MKHLLRWLLRLLGPALLLLGVAMTLRGGRLRTLP